MLAEQIRGLVGRTAPPWLLQVITWMSVQHSPRIIAVETVKAASIGVNYLVEVKDFTSGELFPRLVKVILFSDIFSYVFS